MTVRSGRPEGGARTGLDTGNGAGAGSGPDAGSAADAGSAPDAGSAADAVAATAMERLGSGSGPVHRRFRPSAEVTVFALATCVYVVLAAPGVGWMDSGELTAAGWTLGGAHPPGHPAHTLVAKLAAFLPVGEIAFRVNLVSAVALGAALAGVVALGRRLVPDRDAGVAAGAVGAALAGLCPAALVNATRAEVYAPTAALLVGSLVAALDFMRRDPDGRAPDGRLFLVAALGCALAAAFHPVIAGAVALPIAVALCLRARRRLLRLAPLSVALGALALVAYAYMPARATAASPPLLLWGDPATLSGFIDLVTAAAYQTNFSASGIAERFASSWLLAGEGTGLGLLIGGLVGLGFGAATRLRGAATGLAVAGAVVLGAALQGALNPDHRGYLLVAVLVLAAGLAPLAGAALRLLPGEIAGPDARTRRLTIAALLIPVAAVGLVFGRAAELDRDDAPTRHWSATIGSMPAGPGLYMSGGDHTLFAAQYERLVAGGRPDIAVANPELCRDEWFLRHVKRLVPELHVPYVDDGVRGVLAERLAVSNMRKARPVAGDFPAFGRLDGRNARPLGRGYLHLLEAGDATPGEQAPAPPDYSGMIGRRVAGSVGLARAAYEVERGRLLAAAQAAGLDDRFTADQKQALAAARPRRDRPALVPILPRHTLVVLYEPWMGDLFADDLAWMSGLDVPPPPEDAPSERQIHALWRALVSGRVEPGGTAFLDPGHDVATATTRLLVQVGDDAAVARHLAALLARWPDDAAATALHGSLRFNQGDLEGAEALLRRATELAPGVAETHARLSVVLERRGKQSEARAAWRRALELNPGLKERAAPAAR